jgi:transposase
MYYRFDLTDEQWQRIQTFFPDRFHHGQAGHPWKDHRPLVNGILWHLHTGAPWPDTPRRYGPWQTVYDRFNLARLHERQPRLRATAPGRPSTTASTAGARRYLGQDPRRPAAAPR